MCNPLTYTYKLDTDRLYLEPLTAADLPILHSLLTDESVRRYLFEDQMISMSQSAEILETVLNTFSTHGYGLWLIYLKDSLEMVGFVGLYTFFSEPQPQLLYALLPYFEKKGYATEASRGIIRYAFEKLGYTYLLASCDVPNRASEQVMKRLGMQLLKEDVQDGKPIVFYQINT